MIRNTRRGYFLLKRFQPSYVVDLMNGKGRSSAYLSAGKRGRLSRDSLFPDSREALMLLGLGGSL